MYLLLAFKMNYSFEGNPKSRPEQNLSGASKKMTRDILLQKTQEERLKRQVSKLIKYLICVLRLCVYSEKIPVVHFMHHSYSNFTRYVIEKQINGFRSKG